MRKACERSPINPLPPAVGPKVINPTRTKAGNPRETVRVCMSMDKAFLRRMTGLGQAKCGGLEHHKGGAMIAEGRVAVEGA